jgi:hypothetical protein
MNAKETAERLGESLNYYSPIWYTLSGCARVARRGAYYRAEVRIGDGYVVIGEGDGSTLDEAVRQALSADRFDRELDH